MDPNFYKEYFELEKAHWWFRARRNILSDIIKRHVGAPSKQKVFDAGCGSGFFVRHLASMGYDSSGADMFAPAVDYGEGQGIKNLTVMHGERIESPDNSYDCVVALDVLEHLQDESGMIKEVERVLRPGGVAIVTVPAFMFLWGRQDEVSYHYRRYTKGSLLSVVRSQVPRMAVVFASYYNFLLFLPIASIRIASRLLKVKEKRGSDFEINSGFANTLLYKVFNLEKYVLRLSRLPFGVSVVVVLRKN